jgi:hypothetical protein
MCVPAGCVRPSRSGVAVAETIRKLACSGIQQQARRLDRSARDDDHARGLLPRAPFAIEVANAARAAVFVDHDLSRHALGAQFQQARLQRDGQHGVLCPVLGVHLTGESHAPAAAHARRPSVVRHRVAQHRDVERMQPQLVRALVENLELAPFRRDGRHGQRLLARPLKGIVGNVARDA